MCLSANFYLCGGALIADDIVLTAAHCEYFNRSGYQVILNAYSQGVVGQGVERYCSDWASHPNYDSEELLNDYALCKLDRPVDVDESKVRLELNEDNSIPFDGENLTVLGLSWDSNNLTEPDVLQKLSVPALNNQDCRDFGGPYNRITENMLCAGGVPGEDICDGDSGGPLVRRTQKTDGTFVDTHIGIVSHGRGDGLTCGYKIAQRGPAATVYARTSTRIDWIRETSCNLGSQAAWCNNPPPVRCDGSEFIFELDMTRKVTLESAVFYNHDNFVEGDFVYNLTRSDGSLEGIIDTMDFNRKYVEVDYSFSKAYCLEFDTEYMVSVASQKPLDYRLYLDGERIFAGRGDNLHTFTVPYQSNSPSWKSQRRGTIFKHLIVILSVGLVHTFFLV